MSKQRRNILACALVAGCISVLPAYAGKPEPIKRPVKTKVAPEKPAAVKPVTSADVAMMEKELAALRDQLSSALRSIDELKSRIDVLEKPVVKAVPPVSEVKPEQKAAPVAFIEEADAVKPEYVRLISGNDVAFNSSNPVWSPRADILAYEKSDEKKREIMIAEPMGKVIQQVSYKAADQDMLIDELLAGAGGNRVAYNAGMTWSPTGDRYIYMSNGGEGNYDLYQGRLGSEEMLRLTTSNEKDGHADWSAVNRHVVFISSRTGSAQVFLLNPETKEEKQITSNPKAFFYPHWSPDGKDVIVTYGDNDNHDVILIKNILDPRPEIIAITDWSFDDLRPSWSPDGKHIAFYSNYSANENAEERIWNLLVVDMENPSLKNKDALYASIVATNIIPDVEAGPAWLGNSKSIVYVKKDEKSYNPLHVVDVTTKVDRLISTHTKINHDISSSSDGQIAFRAQQDQWDRIFVMKLPAVVQ